jgi:hypothetical protein
MSSQLIEAPEEAATNKRTLPRKPAPKNASKGPGIRGHLEKIAPALLRSFIEHEDVKQKKLADELGMKSPNFIGTALGHGRGGGLRLWRNGTDIRACQENFAAVMDFLFPNKDEDEQFELIAVELGLDTDEVRKSVGELPVASDEAAD